MDKQTLILMIIVCLLLITSCNQKNGQEISEGNYREGSVGLELSFMQNSPPDKVYSGNEMEIIVEVKNLGAYPTTDSFDGKLEIYGFDEKAFSGERWDGGNYLSSNLQGRSQFNPMGGREVKRYHVNEVRSLFDTTKPMETTIMAAACYKYRTIAEPLVCIDPEPYSTFDEEKVCTVSSSGKTYSLSTQGAPVAVTKVTEEISGKNIRFGIHIKNVGKGKVVDEHISKDCPLNLDYNDVNKVVVAAKTTFDSSPECMPRGTYTDPVRLDENGNGFITCSFAKPASKSAFETILNIQLDYKYMDWIKKDIQIVNIDR